MPKIVPLVSACSSGRECEYVAAPEFFRERLSNSSIFVKYAVARGYEHHEIIELSQLLND